METTQQSQAGVAKIKDAQLHYEIAGQGPNLVLVHAGTADKRMWDGQFAAFARHFRVIRYDQRGYGESGMTPSGQTPPGQTPPGQTPGLYSTSRDLYEMLKQLKIEHAHFVASSAGASAVIDLTLEHPEITTSMVLVSAAVSGYEFHGPPPKTVMDLAAARMAGELDKAADLQATIWAVGPKRKANEMNATVRDQLREMARISLTHQAPYLKETGMLAEEPLKPPAIGRLNTIKAPTLVIVGDKDDDSILEIGDLLTTHIPGARKAVLSDTAHMANMEKPEQFNRLVLTFLEQL